MNMYGTMAFLPKKLLLGLSLVAMVGCDNAAELAPLAAEVQPASSEELWLQPGRAPAPSAASFGIAAQNEPAAKNSSLPPIIGLPRELVCQGVTFIQMDGKTVTGERACELPACNDSLTTDCETTAAHRATDLAYVKEHREEFYPSLTIAGVKGAIDLGDLVACEKEGDTNCLSTNDLRAIDKKYVNPGVIRKGFEIAGIKGEYPSAKYPLGPLPAGATLLTPKNFNEALRSNKPFHYWTVFGELRKVTGDARLHVNNIKHGYTVYGVQGKGAHTAGPLCKSEGQPSCVLASYKPWLALNPADLDEKTLKNGVTIGSKTGIYPSASAPLAGSRNHVADLAITASSWNQLTSNDDYEYFDGEGHRYAVNGTKELAAPHIANGLTILGVKGSFDGLDPDAVKPTDLRYGLAIGAGRYGRLDMTADCAGPIDCFKIKKLWSRVEADGKLIDDSCGAHHEVCVIRNAAQQQDWLFDTKSDPMSWQDAASFCTSNRHMKFDDWRMPTQKEVMQAAVNGLAETGHFGHYSQVLAELKFWTSTMYSSSHMIAYGLQDALFTEESNANNARPICVRTP